MMAPRTGHQRQAWMHRTKFATLIRLGWSNEAIAEANFQAKGWRPSPGMVSRHAETLGLPPRRLRHDTLIPWAIRPEHRHDPVYYALQAISRERQGLTLKPLDQQRADWLRDLLTTIRRTPLVVDYIPDRGFVFSLAKDSDDDIVRHPRGEDDQGSSSSGASAPASSSLSGLTSRSDRN